MNPLDSTQISQQVNRLDMRSALIGKMASRIMRVCGYVFAVAAFICWTTFFSGPRTSIEKIDVPASISSVVKKASVFRESASARIGGSAWAGMEEFFKKRLVRYPWRITAVALWALGAFIAFRAKSIGAFLFASSLAFAAWKGPDAGFGFAPSPAMGRTAFDLRVLPSQERLHDLGLMSLPEGKYLAAQASLIANNESTKTELMELAPVLADARDLDALPQVIYAIEMAAYGEPRSDTAMQYIAESAGLQYRHGLFAGLVAAFGIVAGLVGMGSRMLSRSMEQRVRRVRAMIASL